MGFPQSRDGCWRLAVKRTGFTLIELLVVISIIALLLSIIMPALGKAKKQAQSVICRSNLRQVGIGILMYAQNNKDTIVPYYTLEVSPTAGTISTAWFKRLVPDPDVHPFNSTDYVAAYDVLFCPTHKLLPPREDNNPNDIFGKKDYAVDRGEISYGMSATLTLDFTKSGLPLDPAKMASIRTPSHTILVTDAMHKDIVTDQIYGSFFIRPSYQAFGWDVVSIRHQGVCNVLWVDGHVTKVKATDPEDESSIYDREALTDYSMPSNYWDRRPSSR